MKKERKICIYAAWMCFFLLVGCQNTEKPVPVKQCVEETICGLSVIDQSPCITGYPLENALDGNVVDDMAILDGSAENIFFTLKLNQAVPIRKAVFCWSDVPQGIEYKIDYYYKTERINTVHIDADQSEQNISLTEKAAGLLADTLKVEIENHEDIEEIILKKVAVVPSYEWGLDKIRSVEIRENDSASSIEEKLKEINCYVNSLLTYGSGPLYEDRNPNEQELLKYGEGHCGEYAYLLTKYLIQKQIECKTADITMYELGGHSVVEVKWKGHYFVLDPTLNLYYKGSLSDIVEYGVEADSTPYAVEGAAWGKEYFFQNAETIRYYTEVCDSYDIEYLQKEDCIISSNLTADHLPLTIDQKLLRQGQGTFVIQLELEEPLSIYRLKMGFSEDGFSGKIKINLDSGEQKAYDVRGAIFQAVF